MLLLFEICSKKLKKTTQSNNVDKHSKMEQTLSSSTNKKGQLSYIKARLQKSKDGWLHSIRDYYYTKFNLSKPNENQFGYEPDSPYETKRHHRMRMSARKYGGNLAELAILYGDMYSLVDEGGFCQWYTNGCSLGPETQRLETTQIEDFLNAVEAAFFSDDSSEPINTLIDLLSELKSIVSDQLVFNRVKNNNYYVSEESEEDNIFDLVHDETFKNIKEECLKMIENKIKKALE